MDAEVEVAGLIIDCGVCDFEGDVVVYEVDEVEGWIGRIEVRGGKECLRSVAGRERSTAPGREDV